MLLCHAKAAMPRQLIASYVSVPAWLPCVPAALKAAAVSHAQSCSQTCIVATADDTEGADAVPADVVLLAVQPWF